MRISTAQIFSQGVYNLQRTQRVLAEIQQQVATGKRIQQPSDDPIGSSKAQALRESLSVTERFQTNIDTSRSKLQEEETILSNMLLSLQRVRELYIQANNASLDNVAREGVTTEIESRLEEMVGYANAKDSTGAYLFSGFQGQTTPIVKSPTGEYIYQGDEGDRLLQISSSTQVVIADAGASIFANLKTGNGTFTISDPGANNIGTLIAGPGSLIDPITYDRDDYTINFIDNAGTMTYEVRDSSAALITSGNYQENMNLSFKGIQIRLDGQPDDGDNLEVKPSTVNNIFNSVQQMVDTLKNYEDAGTQTPFNQHFSELDTAINDVILAQSRVGSRLNSLDAAELINDDFIIASEELLSNIENVDLAKAITDLEQLSVNLQASQQSFIRISGLSIFNFL